MPMAKPSPMADELLFIGYSKSDTRVLVGLLFLTTHIQLEDVPEIAY